MSMSPDRRGKSRLRAVPSAMKLSGERFAARICRTSCWNGVSIGLVQLAVDARGELEGGGIAVPAEAGGDSSSAVGTGRGLWFRGCDIPQECRAEPGEGFGYEGIE